MYPVAREANHEDEATGRFWAAPAHPCAHGTCASLHIGSRFKSQALLDEKALAACMVYEEIMDTHKLSWNSPITPPFNNVLKKPLTHNKPAAKTGNLKPYFLLLVTQEKTCHKACPFS